MRRAALLVVLLVGLLVPARAAQASSFSLFPKPSVNLLSQTPWVQTKGIFQLHIGLTDPGVARSVQVIVYDQEHTRTGFLQAAGQTSGPVPEFYFYQQVVPVAQLQRDPKGGYDLDLPIGEDAPAGDPFPRVSINEPQGVFPVQVAMVGASGAVTGDRLTTFLVYSQGTAKSQGYTPLSAALIIPFSAPPRLNSDQQLTTPDSSQDSRLVRLAGVLNSDNSVHASLLASPVTLASLSSDPVAMDNLSQTPDNGLMQVLPSTYSPVSLGDLLQAGLQSEVQPQLAAAVHTFNSTLQAVPETGTWVFDGPLDTASLEQVVAHGATRIIVPTDDLTALSTEITTTFAHATNLGGASQLLTVYGADNELAADFTRDASPVLAANVMLADMAMIFTEAPGDQYARGVVAMPPPDWTVNPEFVQTLLTGLQDNPLVSAVTASGLFESAGTTVGTRSLANPNPTSSPAATDLDNAQPALSAARSSINNLADVYPDQSLQLSQIQNQLLLAESETLTPDQRDALLFAIKKVTDQVEHAVSLPPSTSITLTSTEGQIPITILTSGNLHPQVRLVLKSQRLIFQPFQPPDGTCTVPTPTLETCDLSLKTQNTTLKVPVQTRSSGVFPLDVYLYPQHSDLQLGHDQDTVRSTAVSAGAIVLIALALLGLAFWWVRDVRRGRRPKGMVPSPDAGLELETGDPEVDEFFNQPPPDYGDGDGNQLMSPSGAGAGPTPKTDETGR
jgi:hypothetical protein